MDNKWFIIVCIIILLVVGFIAFNTFTNHETEVKIGDSTFQIPEGYHIEKSKKDDVTNLTNGTNNIYIQKYDDKKVKKHIDSYINKTKQSNKTVKISNFTVGKTLVYKANIDRSSAVHFWFVKDNTTYAIYSLDKNPEIDSITTKLIESIT